ncbi:MAG: SpoIVB peptidase S55 domain-containing protein [Pyrinomonadaceae bacterium]
MRVKIFAIGLIIAALCSTVFSQIQAKNDPRIQPTKSTKTQFFPLSELKEGMRGTARTVFRGDKPEEFSVEILGIVPGAIGPKQDMIVGRLSGGPAERTAVFAGMSGSPVYIDGKLVGAIAYSFPFSKEPICGITPIDQMIGIFQENKPLESKNKEPRSFSFSELAATGPRSLFPKGSVLTDQMVAASGSPTLAAVAGQTFQPIATPISFNGFSPATLKFFERDFLSVGLLPVASVGGAAPISPLKKADDTTLLGGDSVSMHLTRGDYSLAAAGTVTYRDGEKIYAFGHPFLSLGTSDLPMSESSVVTVVPSINNSFKMAVPEAMVGSMTQDRATGVYGKLGQAPKMVPVRINLTTSRNQKQTLNFEIARDDSLTPLLLNVGIFNTIVANERGMGDSTIEVEGEIQLKGQKTISIANRFAGSQATQLSSLAVALPLNALFQSRFDNIDISGITVNLASVDGSKTATLERISLNKTEVRAGETLEVQAFVRTDTGRVFSQKIPVLIPADTPSGKVMISVGDGGSIQQNSASKQFVPQDLSELVKTINELKKSDRLYVQTYRVTNGAIIGASEMPNLPPSVLATLNNNRTAGGFTPTVQTVLTEQELPPAEFLISGQQTLQIEVVK